MREILFRGKRTDNHKWIEGTGVFNDSVNTWIFANEPNRAIAYGMQHYIVNPETVGQYTGLTDKNGTKIFEGDILKTVKGVGYVVYGKGCFCVQYEGQNKPAIDIVMYYGDMSVIGNIHDNPELLKGE